MRVALLKTFDELAGGAVAWNALAGGVPFRRWEFCRTWWRHYGAGRALFVLAVHDNHEQLLGLAPWYVDASVARGRVVRFLGDGEVCADYCTLLCRPQHAPAVAVALADWLIEHSNTWDLLELSAIPCDDAPLHALVQALGEQACGIASEPTLNCWRLTFPPTWEDYEKLLSKSHRKQVRRMQERLLKTGRARLHTAQSGALAGSETDFQRVFQILIDLHQKRWVSRGEPGVFASPRYLAFHRELAEQFLQLNRLRLQWLEIDGRPAAAEYHFAGDDAVYGYQGGVEPEMLELEPGTVAIMAALQAALRDGFGAFDFLRGDEPYKPHWRAQPRACRHVRIVPNRRAARLRFRAWQKARELKRWWQGTSLTAAPLPDVQPAPASPLEPLPSP